MAREAGGVFWDLCTQQFQLIHLQWPQLPRGAWEFVGRDGVNGGLGLEVVQEDCERRNQVRLLPATQPSSMFLN